MVVKDDNNKAVTDLIGDIVCGCFCVLLVRVCVYLDAHYPGWGGALLQGSCPQFPRAIPHPKQSHYHLHQ